MQYRKGDARGVNSQYAFALTRSSEDGEWAKVALEARTNGIPKLVSDFEVDEKNQKPVLLHLFGAFSLDEILARPGAEILSTAQLENEVVAIEFRAPMNDITAKGTALLDGKNLFCIKSATIEAHPWTVQVANEYAATDGLPIAKKHSERRQRSPVQGQPVPSAELFITEYDLSIPTKLPSESTFTLTAFGLPEPFGADPPPQPIPWFLYAGVGAGLIIVLIILLGIWQRRLARGAS